MNVRRASTRGKKVPESRREYRKVLDEMPAGYDAHKDGLADAWEHRETVNTLLRCLRAAVAEIDTLKDEANDAC